MVPRILCGLLALISVGQVAGHTYYRETLTSIWTSTHERVEVIGTVAVVTLRQDRAITFRIRDEQGRVLGCLWPPGKGEQPRVGVTIRVSGVRHRFEVPHLGYVVTEIDPVEHVEPLE